MKAIYARVLGHKSHTELLHCILTSMYFFLVLVAPYFGEQHQGGPSFSPPYQSGVASSYEDAKAQCNAAGARLKAINDRQWDSTESANQFFVTPLPQWYPAYNIQKDTRSGSLENVPRVVSCERKFDSFVL